MISKLFPLFFVLVRLALISSEDEFSRMPKLQTIQDEIFKIMSQYTQGSWNEIAPERQNYHIFPIVLKIQHYFILMELYHGTLYRDYLSQDQFLERPYEFARILDKLRNNGNTSEVVLKFPSAIFYDRKYMVHRFVNDLETYYHTEKYEISFEPQYEKFVTMLINNWTSANAMDRKPKESYRKTPIGYRSVFLNFAGCWESATPDTTYHFKMSNRRKRFMPAIPVLSKLKFELLDEEIEVETFNGRETIGYYKDVERKFEAIRIPFKNKDFAMVVMLPYYNQSLEIFKNFTVSDYRQLLRRVNESYEPVDYTIPVINSNGIVINDEGARINRIRFCYNAHWGEEPEPTIERNFYHRPFLVDRPFGILIYEEKSMIVLMYALMRNPLLKAWPTPKFKIQLNMYGEEDTQPSV